jgi:hypothetical protein
MSKIVDDDRWRIETFNAICNACENISMNFMPGAAFREIWSRQLTTFDHSRNSIELGTSKVRDSMLSTFAVNSILEFITTRVPHDHKYPSSP